MLAGEQATHMPVNVPSTMCPGLRLRMSEVHVLYVHTRGRLSPRSPVPGYVCIRLLRAYACVHVYRHVSAHARPGAYIRAREPMAFLLCPSKDPPDFNNPRAHLELLPRRGIYIYITPHSQHPFAVRVVRFAICHAIPRTPLFTRLVQVGG